MHVEQTATPSSPRRDPKRVLILFFSILLFFGFCIALWFWYEVSSPLMVRGGGVEMTIEEGSSVPVIAEELYTAGVIRGPFLFKLYAKLSGKAEELQAGDYTFPEQISIVDAVDYLTGGGASGDVSITIIEGWNSDEIETYLLEQGLEMSDFAERASDGEFVNASMKIFQDIPTEASLEGFLFPDTYSVLPDATSADVIGKMLHNFEKKVTDEMWKQIEKSEYSFYEILTLASIIEKEVRTNEERRIVAGIFLKRLEDGHPLESDATVNYITGKNTTRATVEDIAIESAYNTYKNVGLPPGPISNPGIDAIQAVLEPAETAYYYFLTTPEPEGKAIFSKTFEEHLQNKAKYYP